MSRYAKVFTHTSTDPWFRSLPADSHRLLWLHLLTCPESRDWGLYRLDVREAARVVVDADVETVLEGFAEQSRVGWDNNSDLLFLPKALRYNPCQNPNQAVGITKSIEVFHRHWMVRLLLGAALEYDDKLAPELAQYCNDRGPFDMVPATLSERFPQLDRNQSELLPSLNPKPTTLIPQGNGCESSVENTRVVESLGISEGGRIRWR